jgi:hypothetical protein
MPSASYPDGNHILVGTDVAVYYIDMMRYVSACNYVVHYRKGKKNTTCRPYLSVYIVLSVVTSRRKQPGKVPARKYLWQCDSTCVLPEVICGTYLYEVNPTAFYG